MAKRTLFGATCGAARDGDPDEDPTGDAGRPIGAECARSRDFLALVAVVPSRVPVPACGYGDTGCHRPWWDLAPQVPTILKSHWPAPPADNLDAPFGSNGAAVEACLARARALTRSEIVRLDVRERRDPDLPLAAWDHVRDRFGADPLRARRLAAREAAWQAVSEAATRWASNCRSAMATGVAQGPGAGAARVTRYLACALVAPTALDAERFEVILDSWRMVIGDLPGVPNSD